MLQFVERVGSPEPLIDCIAVPDAPANDSITQGRQRYLLALLGARRRVHAFSEPLAGLESEFFVQWGAEPNEAKSRAEVYRSAFARPKLHLEDGFVRSIGLWTDPNEPTCSIVLDPLAVYYDATRPSLLEDWLNSDREISMAERARARKLIDRLTQERISKYNYAPDMDLGLGPAPRRRILLVDQKAGDMSLRYGLASPDTFAQMLTEAVEFADAGGEVLIKQHPCAITGGESEAHYTRKSLVARGAFRPNIHLLGFDINPFALFDPVDEVWVATSGMGLEALFAGRRVRTFGAPFYGGWGLTEDTMVIPRRRRSRTLEDVFHAFYLRLSRYVDPRTGRRCELEDLLDAITAARAELGT
jgi:capsular polysaccharide export protein